LGEIQPGDRETNRRMEDAMMLNESSDHRRYASMYSIERRTGGESGAYSGSESGRSDKAEGRTVD
jgi:hypothetical protein